MKRKAGLYLLSISLCAHSAAPAAAQSGSAGYPARPIRVVVPQSPGGANDLTARLIGPLVSERIGQPLVIDNRPGAGSLVGTDLVAKAAPDGYTLLVTPSSITIIPSMYRKIPFDPMTDFAPVTLLAAYPNVVVVHPSVPVNSVKELIALARAKPGTLNFGSGGIGTPTQMGPELFKSMAGVNIVHVPYKGGGPALTALLGGEVQLYFGPIATVLPYVKAGKIKALAVTSGKRTSVAPELPSVAEAGLRGFEYTTWIGLLAPARTPHAIVAKLNSDVAAVLKMPVISERFAADGMEPGGISSVELAAVIRNETALWAKVIRNAGITPE